MKNFGKLGLVLGVALLMGSAAVPHSVKVVSAKEITVSTEKSQGNKKQSKNSQVSGMRFLHGETKDFIRYVAAQNILDEEELKTLEDIELKVKSLRTEKRSIMKESNEKFDEGASKKVMSVYDKKIDELNDKIEKLYKENEAIYQKVSTIISDDMVAVSKEGKALDFKQYLEQTHLFTDKDIEELVKFNKMGDELGKKIEESEDTITPSIMKDVEKLEKAERKVGTLLNKLEAYEEKLEDCDIMIWNK